MNVSEKNNLVKYRILVIDDEPIVGLSCKRILSLEQKYEIKIVTNPLEGLKEASTDNYDLILLDIVMPELDGIEILKRIKALGISSEIVIITGYATVQTAIEAIKQGAADYICKPFTPDELNIVIEKVVKHSVLLKENIALRKELHMHQGFIGIIGETPNMEKIFSIIKHVAPTNGTVIISGESGTGKELIAKAIHRLSQRNDKPFIACDCSALAPTLLESELFGHVKGSFTGAIAHKKGLFEIADKGTLFLDEISNICLETQSKLLRVLENSEIKKVGDIVEQKIDIRLIVATNKNLLKMIKDETFREDLFYRLQVVPIHIPPLRERKEDIPRLALTFLERFRKKNKTKVRNFALETISLFDNYNWPGNVRELKNLVERLAILCDSEIIEPADLPYEFKNLQFRDFIHKLPQKWDEFKELKQQIQENAIVEIEKRFLIEALQRSGGNVSNAAEDVGMQRTNFHQLLKLHKINSKNFA
ncbi:MAG: sigma-54-dependent Fis family transcriptional regulator [Bacteroidales bacterium]|nr:sigma-54-dependent Fis family transcriptional regulator [Bacteroidales bacterium]